MKETTLLVFSLQEMEFGWGVIVVVALCYNESPRTRACHGRKRPQGPSTTSSVNNEEGGKGEREDEGAWQLWSKAYFIIMSDMTYFPMSYSLL